MKRCLKIFSALILTAALALGVFAPIANAASPKIITGTASYVSGSQATQFSLTAVEQKLTYRYSDAWFAEPSTQYSHELARMSLALQKSCWAAADTPGADNTKKLDGTGRTRAAAYVHQLYKKIGFTPLRYYRYDVPLTDEEDRVAWSMAEKKVTLNGERCVLLAVSIRGGNYGGEWVSNGNVGNTDAHAGFKAAAEELIREVGKQLDSYAKTLIVKLWVNGYSRSGAVGNLLAGALDRDIAAGKSRLKKENLFCYNFAVPLCTKDKKANTEIFSNIFNIINPVDVIMIAPFRAWGFRRYGIEKFLNFLEQGPEYDRLNAQFVKLFEGKCDKDTPFTLHLVTWEHFKTLYLIDALLPAFLGSTADLMGFQEAMMNLIRSFFVQGTLVSDAESGNWKGLYEGIFGKGDALWAPVYAAVKALMFPVNGPVELFGGEPVDPGIVTLVLCALEQVGAALLKRPPNPLHIIASLPGLAVSLARMAMATSDSGDAQGFVENIKAAHSTESYTVLMGRPESEAFGNGEIKGLSVT
ncbi:MAG: hypothetical protein FWC27_07640 [Firmicutes bacterium]|nr:hypothetical protein [Bacillota bacterium]